jgi:hypothetical protein
MDINVKLAPFDEYSPTSENDEHFTLPKAWKSKSGHGNSEFDV